MLYEVVFFILIIVVGTAGELCVTRAMKSMGEVTDFRPAALIKIVPRALSIGWMRLGLTLMAVAFFSLLGMLSLEKVSIVIPMTALSYVVGTVGGKLFLREQVSWRRCAGVLLVCVGIALVVLSNS